MWYLFIPIFIMAFGLSYLLNSGSLAILTKKPNRAAGLSALTGILSWANFYLIGKISDWSIPLMIAEVMGDMAGDWLVAKRKPTKKPRTTKKIQKKFEW